MERGWASAAAKSARPWRKGAAAALLALFAAAAAPGAHAAEYGTGPWAKGYTDLLGGLVPPLPGLYVRGDAYHYQGDADRLIFNGKVSLGLEQDYMASLLALSYVTPLKILGGTYAVAVVPSVVAMEVNAGVSIPAFNFQRGPFNRQIGPFEFDALGNEVALGDTAFAPLLLGWNSGNFWWNLGVFGLAPTGEYDKSNIANTSLHHWSEMTRLAGTYFDPQTGFQATGAAVYSVSWENPSTDYETGNILNLEGSITQNLSRTLGVGGVGYAMIQTTGDSGAGAKLGSFESKVYGLGPILTYTLGEGPTALTLLAKWYAEFGAENTFEGNTIDVAASFKF